MKQAMKHTIRYRFTLIFAGMTALILVATWCANTLWLEDYYINDKIHALEAMYERIDEKVMEIAEHGGSITDDIWENEDASHNDSTSLAYMIREFCEKYNAAMVMIDSSNGEVVFSSARDRLFLADQLQRYLFGQNTQYSEMLRDYENYKIQKRFEPRAKSFYLESWGYFSDNQTNFIVSTPLASIQESTAIFNRFQTQIGILAILITGILMYITTKKVTKPIMELADLSEKMSKLDFEAKYTGDAKDELGILGNSMNVLSETLKNTIGELKSVNHQLQRDIEEKVQIDEMRKEFIANVSHELKTPIALIQGYAEGLVEGMGEDRETRDYYCEVIMDETAKMNRMVRQLLTLTALESGNDAPVMERFDIVEVVRGVLDNARILIEQSQAQVEFSSMEPIYVWADEFKIEEVITNYVSNALNHMAGERKLRLTIEPGDQVRVSVYNTGLPIPEQDIPNLWTKFYKVDKARTREYGGSGIGLSIVKAIVDAHHQECGAENVENGVEFWFTLDGKSQK